MRGPVAWSPGRRPRDRVRPAGRVQIVGERTVDTGTDAALLAWAGRRLVAVGSDGRGGRGVGVPTPVESAVSAGERRGRAEPRVAGVHRPSTGAIRQVALPGVVHGGLAASSRAAYVADAGGVLEVTPDGVVTRRLATARRAKGSRPVADGRTDRRHARRRRMRQGDPQRVRAAVRAAADRHPARGSRECSTRAPRGSSAPAAHIVRRARRPARLHGGRVPAHPRAAGPRRSPPRSAPRTPTRTSSARSAAATRAIDLRTGKVRMLPARVPYLL